MGKDKKEKRKSEAGENEEVGESWDVLVSRIQPIANPLASRKLNKRIFKVIKKAQKAKHLTKGQRDVQKALRKGQQGLVILAGDTEPLDVIVHLPGLCEDKSLPYCYTPSRQELGLATGTKRSVCVVMVKPGDDYKELYDEVLGEVSALPLPI